MKRAKHCNTQSRESRICPSLETTKTQLEQGFSDLMRMWVENWSRWSPEAPSNLNYSVILQRAQALSLLHFLSFKYIAYVSISLYASHHLCLLGNWWKNLYFLFPSTLEPSEYFGGRDSCEQILFSSNIFYSFCFWHCPLLLDAATPQPTFLAPDHAPNFSSCNSRKVTCLQLHWEGCQHYQQKNKDWSTLVSSLNDFKKQLKRWSHQFQDWGMNRVATNAWGFFFATAEV